MKKTLVKALVVAAVAAGGVAVTAGSANAYVVCNGEHECWHTQTRYHYRTPGMVVHRDNWRWRGEGWRWHEHEGRGYWRNGVWITF